MIVHSVLRYDNTPRHRLN